MRYGWATHKWKATTYISERNEKQFFRAKMLHCTGQPLSTINLSLGSLVNLECLQDKTQSKANESIKDHFMLTL